MTIQNFTNPIHIGTQHLCLAFVSENLSGHSVVFTASQPKSSAV